MNKHTLIIGIGNTILSDDGAGIYVAREIKKIVGDLPNITIVEASLGGIGLLDLIAGFKRVIIVDSIKTENGKPGTFYKLRTEDLGKVSYPCGPHFLYLVTTIELGKSVGYKMPGIVDIYAIEIENNTTFSENLNTEVEKAVHLLTKQIIDDIKYNTEEN